MPLLDQVLPQPTAAEGAVRIRHAMRQAVMQIEHSLQNVNQTVREHGRQAIAAELGPDATELQTVYNKLKTCLQDIDASRDVPDLPT